MKTQKVMQTKFARLNQKFQLSENQMKKIKGGDDTIPANDKTPPPIFIKE